MWNAEIYNRYGKERVQPSIDLAARIKDMKFQRILDVGCGTGMSTAPLVSAWERAEIIGVDLSKEMLEKAREILPTVTFIQRDCSKPLLDMGTFDLIFSNAFVQWLPDQEDFISNAFSMLNENGIFAAQIPLFEEMPANQCIIKAEKIFADKFKEIGKDKYILHSAPQYYDMVAKCTNKIEMWITDYCHEMDNHGKVLEFLMGAALRPHIDRLNEEEQELFMDEVMKNLEIEYHDQANGKILFPFKRLFLVGQK